MPVKVDSRWFYLAIWGDAFGRVFRRMAPFARIKIVALGIIAGSLFSAACAASQLPTSWGLADRATAWLWYMSGPFCPLSMKISEVSNSFVLGCVAFGFLSIPMIAAHPIWPSPKTAVVSFLGFALWFNASFFTIVWAIWGA
jgi:hypothetical protein